MYQEAADIRDVYLYKKFAVQVGSWYTGGGERCSIDKKPKGCRLKTHKIRYSQWKNYVNRPHSDKSMKFCIVVVHDLTNDISYNAKLNR